MGDQEASARSVDAQSADDYWQQLVRRRFQTYQAKAEQLEVDAGIRWGNWEPLWIADPAGDMFCVLALLPGFQQHLEVAVLVEIVEYAYGTTARWWLNAPLLMEQMRIDTLPMSRLLPCFGPMESRVTAAQIWNSLRVPESWDSMPPEMWASSVASPAIQRIDWVYRSSWSCSLEGVWSESLRTRTEESPGQEHPAHLVKVVVAKLAGLVQMYRMPVPSSPLPSAFGVRLQPESRTVDLASRSLCIPWYPTALYV